MTMIQHQQPNNKQTNKQTQQNNATTRSRRHTQRTMVATAQCHLQSIVHAISQLVASGLFRFGLGRRSSRSKSRRHPDENRLGSSATSLGGRRGAVQLAMPHGHGQYPRGVQSNFDIDSNLATELVAHGPRYDARRRMFAGGTVAATGRSNVARNCAIGTATVGIGTARGERNNDNNHQRQLIQCRLMPQPPTGQYGRVPVL
mmetsp:Transcript_21028/g.58244  ORF Transcript_21028/g.58244 Transcript_21028/m.58244 type:complete len:202 (+) Transcript_21028:3-608(+)